MKRQFSTTCFIVAVRTLCVFTLLTLNAWSALALPISNSKPDTALIAATNIAALMPGHGTVSTLPARKWEESMVSGNGIMGAMLAGDPRTETLIINHCKLWLPLGSREVVPDIGNVLPDWRKVIGEKGYPAGHEFFLMKAKEQGWDGKLVWTDPFHPGFVIKIDQPASEIITDFARIEDFQTGEVSVQWRTDQGGFSRRMFVSRTDNVVILRLAGPKGRLSLNLKMDKINNSLIQSTLVHSKNLITCQNTYVNGKGGYDGAVRIAVEGGTVTCDQTSIDVAGADGVTLIMRIEPWKQPLPGSEAWPFSALNPQFSAQTASKSQKAAQSYQPEWMTKLKQELESLPSDYTRLISSHAKVHGDIFNRVTIDLGGNTTERELSSEALLDLAQKEKRLPAALLERMYDAGRYMFLCSAGPDTPPNLFGIWTGTWKPAWSGDYTLDTNVQLEVESAFSGNMADCLSGYFNLMESFVPDFQTNATKLYGCRGILSGTRASNTGIHLHWDAGWPGEVWTPGAPWLAHWFYDYYLYTGDRKFLSDRAVPFMKDCALFYEDFLKGTEDAKGKYTFRPSYSAENGWADNATQDISICRELLGNLIAACKTLGIEPDGVQRWKTMLTKLPPYLINADGQLQEWATPGKDENNNHRHLMHLYGAFESQEFSEEADPAIFQAARVAVLNRIKYCKERSTHGRMHVGLAATGLGMGNEAYSRLEIMATLRSMYPSLITGHEPGPEILCVDGNGAIPEIVNRMVIQSKSGQLMLLQAVPDALPQGTLSGTKARGQIDVDRLTWNMKTGTLSAILTSMVDQEIALVLPPGMTVDQLTADGKPQQVIAQGVRKQGCTLRLPKGKTVTVEARFHPMT